MSNAWNRKSYRDLYNVLVKPMELFKHVNYFWNNLKDPRDYHTARIGQYCGYSSRGKAVFYYLLREMIQEDEILLKNVKRHLCQRIQKEHPDIPWANPSKHPDFDILLESRERAARYLAVIRAEARMLGTLVPDKIDSWKEEPWMNIKRRRNKDGTSV